jgi:hypothetical protein
MQRLCQWRRFFPQFAVDGETPCDRTTKGRQMPNLASTLLDGVEYFERPPDGA